MGPTNLPGQTMTIRVKKNRSTCNTLAEHNDGGFLVDSQVRMPGELFTIDAKKAEELIRQGLADAVVEMPISKAQRAVEPKLEASRRG